ncbi:MAG: metallophosphoesterase [Bacteroidota bacterium]
MNKIIFISIFSLVFLSASYYVFIRGYQAMPNIYWLKLTYSILFWTLSASFIVSRFTGTESLMALHFFTTWVGVFWMVASLYFFLIVLSIDLIRLVNHFAHFLPLQGSPQAQLLKYITLSISVFVVSGLIIYGNYNARHAQIVHLNLKINKTTAKYKHLRIAMASDIHLGTIVNARYLGWMTENMNSFYPDIIMIPGDILDEELTPILKYNIGKPLKELKAPLGIWAVPGNHEHIGNFSQTSKYLNSLNINLLVDTSVFIDSSFYLVGRDDKDASRFSGKKRASLDVLMENIDTSKPIILLDHQPFALSESQRVGVDLQLSGHTHNGQFWPFNYITNSIFEKSWGYLKKGMTHFYVSSGYGTWGPPVRIGNRPEIVIIDIDFLK